MSATDPRLDVLRRLNQIAIGKEVQAMVDSMLDDGNFLVRVGDGQARMALPVGTRVGDQLSMVFIAREPRPTFLLNQPGGSAPATLSATARLIDHVLQAAGGNASAAVNAGAPLLAAADADPARIAGALQDSLGRSGLFYESHLQDWLNGSRTLEELAQEPQARLAQPGTRPEQSGADMARLADSMRDLGDGVHKLLDLMRDAKVQAANPQMTDADVIARADAGLPPIDPEAARLINLQLNALEQQQMRWRGELWPGQELEWEVSRDQGGGGAGQEVACWSSAVRFELPHLGAVSATIRLLGGRVQLQVNTDSDDAAALLRGHADSLAQALDAAGAPLDAMLVKRDEQA
ncbi:MAG TPA: flagellar hook-length control protein FliK [Noviherbaspirillum sp.]|uniref:flagellar hook-length control protein FliK n=1 Tax=Noviherbaspirillum sp. TaxID=1926288 RepID=UPI002F9293AD